MRRLLLLMLLLFLPVVSATFITDSLANFTTPIFGVNATFLNIVGFYNSSTVDSLIVNSSSASSNFSQFCNLSNMQSLNDTVIVGQVGLNVSSVNSSLNTAIGLVGSNVSSINSTLVTAVGAVAVNLSSVNSSKSGVGSCSAGSFVQNTTVSGVQCIPVSGSGSVTSVSGGIGLNGSINSSGVIDLNGSYITAGWGNWSADKSSYNTTSQLNSLYYSITNPSNFISSFVESDPVWSAVSSSYVLKSGVVGLVGNWSLDKSSYNTTVENNNLFVQLTNLVSAVGNWSADKSSYNTTVQLQKVFYNQTYLDSKLNVETHLADSVGVPTGTLTSGNLVSVQTLSDNDWLNVSEVSGVPGWEVDLNFTNITQFNQIYLNVWYQGSSAHEVDVQLYNFNTSSWTSFGVIPTDTMMSVITFGVANDGFFINGTNVSLRIYHASSGNPAHRFRLDYVALQYGNAFTDVSQLATYTSVGQIATNLSSVNSTVKDLVTDNSTKGNNIANLITSNTSTNNGLSSVSANASNINSTLVTAIGLVGLNTSSINSTLNTAVGADPFNPPSSCVYGGSGLWNVSCAEGCTIQSSYNLSTQNLTFTGSGTITLNNTIFVPNKSVVHVGSCKIMLTSTGKFKG